MNLLNLKKKRTNCQKNIYFINLPTTIEQIRVTKHQPLVWFGMVHLIFTNINLWIHSLAREIFEEYKHHTYKITSLHNSSEIYFILSLINKSY